jgi:hypothetical protein
VTFGFADTPPAKTPGDGGHTGALASSSGMRLRPSRSLCKPSRQLVSTGRARMSLDEPDGSVTAVAPVGVLAFQDAVTFSHTRRA